MHVKLRSKALLADGYKYVLGTVNNPIMVKFHTERGGSTLIPIKA